MRDRLIELLDNATVEKTKCYPSGTPAIMYCEKAVSRQVVYQLADYLLENGVIVPPCKVGDTVYWIDNGKIKCEEVFEISIHSDGILVHTGIQFCLSQVFLSREDAEQALKGGEGCWLNY